MINGLINGARQSLKAQARGPACVSECVVTSAVSSPPYTPIECRQAAWGLSPRIRTRSRVRAGSDPGHSACCGGRAGVQLCSHRRGSVGRGPGVAGAGAGPGTRGAQAAARFSVLVVFLLLELGHQAEFTTAAALGKIQHHVLGGRGEME